MKKLSRSGDRLSSAVNARFDLVAPMRELESNEKQIDKIRKESQKVYESEMKQLSRRLEGMPAQQQRFSGQHSSFSQDGPSVPDSRKTSEQRSAEAAMHKLSRDNTLTRSEVVSSMRSRSPSVVSNPFFLKDWQFSEDSSVTSVPGQSSDKLGETLRQLKFLYDTAVALVADAEATGTSSIKGRISVTYGKADDQQSVTSEDDETPTLKRKMLQKQVSLQSPPATRETKTGEYSQPSSQRTSRVSRTMASTVAPPEYAGVPSQAVQLMSLIRVLTLGTQLNAKQVKGLTAVIEECRQSVKAVKGGQDPERAQEKLNKKLAELMDMVKPTGSDMTLTAEQLLNCSYLRLTKDNVSRLEDLLREQGFEPGIHSHSDVTEVPLFERTAASTSGLSFLKRLPSSTQEPFQPTTIYQTKAGAPMSKKRTARPDSIVGLSEEEENLAKLKKFRVN